MGELTEDRIREIIRDEIAASKEESSSAASIEMALLRGLIQHNAEELVESLQLPDEAREQLQGYIDGVLKGLD
ncbi:Uncharacterised protein [Mycobacteroides abscessus subsp. massiliense]|uniref:hypothetical protein n=1 Tax=Mycobacteroides abscessus TaxID=36809 RepID=UPI0005E91D1D|nr:hypothetical protein [Mycobacteroides abscessus]MBL3753043.1 hypothetical protein [Mycobacteroides abscessus subsp. massiliense]CPX29781.1 Uncharacterised protein [Mycobacteroides abscessus]SKD92648.1 Uncharacterised protein [Mycobacteroides abscessus subsp. massiliense]SKE05333.1 Uncharacterised protein [Mycobacteroides abscessus subsp. massiliense]SKE07072.1 Uncharacterised protein [Mycobacteroides abscessus subsp. massiliense]